MTHKSITRKPFLNNNEQIYNLILLIHSTVLVSFFPSLDYIRSSFKLDSDAAALKTNEMVCGRSSNTAQRPEHVLNVINGKRGVVVVLGSFS